MVINDKITETISLRVINKCVSIVFHCVVKSQKNQKHLLCIDLQGKNIYYLNIAPNMFTGIRRSEILRRKRTNESDFNSWIFKT